ncbi:MAG: aldehyde dehydrogenase family protein, partial [Candidatus Desulfofervidus sp.]|nr:aldehyde dehydrogenase family protein [Candidatus Desulfofervidus sp.]
MRIYPILIGNRPKETDNYITINSPYDNQTVAKVCMAGEREIEEAIEKALKAFSVLKHLPVYVKANALMQISQGVKKRAEEIARMMALEAGKPISLAKIEVSRCIELFQYASEEVK